MSLSERYLIENELEKWEIPVIHDEVRTITYQVTILIIDQVHARLENFMSDGVKGQLSLMKPDAQTDWYVPTEDATHFVDRTIHNWVAKMPVRLIDLEHHSLVSRSDLAIAVKTRMKARYIPDEKDSGETSFVEELAKVDRGKWKHELKKELTSLLSFAIFSHRWCSSEPNLQDAQRHLSEWLPRRLSEPSTPHHDPGLRKLVMFCRTAHALGYRLAWTDTCCIDQTSSAEYQESINAMFTWYRQAHLCIVHMAQTGHLTSLANHTSTSGDNSHGMSRVGSTASRGDEHDPKQPLYYLHNSKLYETESLQLAVCDNSDTAVRWEDAWFSRGWTLPELLAPRALKFYTWDWQELVQRTPNHKNHPQLLKLLEAATEIPAEAIRDFDLQKRRTFSEKMRWASKRSTTRGEDQAYCLLGLFELNMPVLYGEGKENAFFRLQLEYMKSSSDSTIFQWQGKPSSRNSLMASDPACFTGRPDDVDTRSRYQTKECSASWLDGCLDFLCCCIPAISATQYDALEVSPNPDFNVTNKGVCLNLNLYPVSVDAVTLEGKVGVFQEKYMLHIIGYHDAEVWVRPHEITKTNRRALMAARFHDTLILLRPADDNPRSDIWIRIHTEHPIQSKNHWAHRISRITQVRNRVIYIQ